MKLYCVRHGTTHWTVTSKYSGTSDPNLNDQGRDEAQAIADHLSDHPFDAVVSSPLVRCSETTDIICARSRQRLTPLLDRRVQEIHYGDWEGRTQEDILSQNPDAFASWNTDPTLKPPPGGESVAEVATRLNEVLSELIRQNHGQVLLVAHRTVLRVLVAQALAIPLKYYRQRLDHLPAALTILDLKAPTEGKLLLYNFRP